MHRENSSVTQLSILRVYYARIDLVFDTQIHSSRLISLSQAIEAFWGNVNMTSKAQDKIAVEIPLSRWRERVRAKWHLLASMLRP